MGLLDDPMGYLFGDEDQSGSIDKRVEREDEGKEFWRQWSAIFGDSGVGDPSSLYKLALESMTKSPVKVNFGGQTFTVTPKSASSNANAYLGLLSPWFDAGMELERGRYGSTYYDEGDSGLLGTIVSGLSSGAGKGIGTKLAG